MRLVPFWYRVSGSFGMLCTSLLRSVLKSISHPGLERLLDMSLNPLRRIVSRTLEVYEYHSNGRPRIFAINDILECGHNFLCLGWDIFDLINPYSENPQVKARGHRCRDCAKAIASKRPVQSATNRLIVRRTA